MALGGRGEGRGLDSGNGSRRLPEQIAGQPGHGHPAALALAVKRAADHIVGQLRGIPGSGHGVGGC